MKNPLQSRSKSRRKRAAAWTIAGVAALAVAGYLAWSFYPEAARTVKMHRM